MVEKGDSTHSWIWVKESSFDDNVGYDVYKKQKRMIQLKKVPTDITEKAPFSQ